MIPAESQLSEEKYLVVGYEDDYDTHKIEWFEEFSSLEAAKKRRDKALAKKHKFFRCYAWIYRISEIIE